MISKQTYINAIRDAMPDIILDDAMARDVVDIIFSVPIKGLENGSKVELPGLGIISIDRSRGSECLSYAPESSLLKCLIGPALAKAA